MVIKYLENEGHDIKIDDNWILFKASKWEPAWPPHLYLGWIQLDTRTGLLEGNYYDKIGEKVTEEWLPTDSDLFIKIAAWIGRLHQDASDFEADV
jgi:hypothetical protein